MIKKRKNLCKSFVTYLSFLQSSSPFTLGNASHLATTAVSHPRATCVNVCFALVFFTHSEQSVLVLLGDIESVLQGHSVFLGQFVQRSSLALLHLAGLVLELGTHVAHVLLMGRLLVTQGLKKKK